MAKTKKERRGNKVKVPSPAQFKWAEARLIEAGFTFLFTVMADDAKKEGVENFGKLYVRHNAVTTDKFWLNYKTCNDEKLSTVCEL